MSAHELKRAYSADDYQAYYTDAKEIRVLMQKLLGDIGGLKLIEPCAGEGAFLEGLLGKPSLVHAIDIDPYHVEILARRFGDSIETIQADFIDLFVRDGPFRTGAMLEEYDAVICNPPYGLKFTTEYRKKIKKRFPNLYARESYGLFLYFGMLCLKDGGRFVYIVPDTFFTSRNHYPLRKFLSEETTLTEIIQFRSKRFESVNFGYGSLCIIAGHKRPPKSSDSLRWTDARETRNCLSQEVSNKATAVQVWDLRKSAISGWAHPTLLGSFCTPKGGATLGDIAECRTGIYTGDNKKFCAFDADAPPSRTNGHGVSWEKQVCLRKLSTEEKQRGIAGDVAIYVPLIRGGHREPFEATKHAIKWSRDAVEFYASDKKSRLQNQDFYFRSGLAIPMVTSGRLSASLMRDAVFDQGVVGVFPNDERLIPALLIYLNSEFANSVKKVINPGANNSANYIKRIPVPIFSDEVVKEADEIVCAAQRVGWGAMKIRREAFMEKILK